MVSEMLGADSFLSAILHLCILLSNQHSFYHFHCMSGAQIRHYRMKNYWIHFCWKLPSSGLGNLETVNTIALTQDVRQGRCRGALCEQFVACRHW